MSVSSRLTRGRAVAGLFVVLAVSLISIPALAQSDSNPKYDVFVGYQWLHPGGTVPAVNGDPNNPTPFQVPDMAKGFGPAFTYNFDPHWGGEADLGHNWGNEQLRDHVFGRAALYLAHRRCQLLLAFSGQSESSEHRRALRQQWNRSHRRVGEWICLSARNWLFACLKPTTSGASTTIPILPTRDFPDLRRPSFEGVRLRTGLVFSWGGAPAVTPAASCSVQPGEVLVGEPITATVAISNFNPKHTVTYAWSGNGGQITGKDTTAQIDTTNVAPGSYTVTAHVTDAKEKNNNVASCSANFTVKPLPPKNPPSISISASPTSLQAGGTVNLSANCTSPDSVAVSVANWTASGGTVSGSGSSATLNTAGTSPGSITVGATCTDTRGLSCSSHNRGDDREPAPAPGQSRDRTTGSAALVAQRLLRNRLPQGGESKGWSAGQSTEDVDRISCGLQGISPKQAGCAPDSWRPRGSCGAPWNSIKRSPNVVLTAPRAS